MEQKVYTAELLWERGSRESGPAYSKNHRIIIPDKLQLETNDEKGLVCPEEMLAASVASSLMLAYLHLCAQNDMIVLHYRDWAEATVSRQGDSQTRLERVFLKPRITFKDADKELFRAMAVRLVHEAHDESYVINSLKCKVVIEPFFLWA